MIQKKECRRNSRLNHQESADKKENQNFSKAINISCLKELEEEPKFSLFLFLGSSADFEGIKYEQRHSDMIGVEAAYVTLKKSTSDNIHLPDPFVITPLITLTTPIVSITFFPTTGITNEDPNPGGKWLQTQFPVLAHSRGDDPMITRVCLVFYTTMNFI